jgi:LacI family transcriptional regulator
LRRLCAIAACSCQRPLVTDAPDSERLTSVSADPYTSGAIVGELLTRFLPGGGQVAFCTGWLTTYEHALELRGFQEGLGSAGGALTLASVVEAG